MAPALRPLLKDACKRPQLSGRHFRLRQRLRLQAEGRSLILTRRSLGHLCKSTPDHDSHVCFLMSAPLRPVSVTHQ